MRNEKLIYARKSKVLTQEELAKKIGLSITGYWRKENGYRSFTEQEIQKICEVLEVKPADIFFNY